LVGFVALSAMIPFFWLRPSVGDIGWGLFIGTFATAGQWLMIMAYGKARAAVLAPLTYAQLIWATALGFIVFGAVPGAWTYGGAAIIAASGLYIAYREGRKRAAHRPAPIDRAGGVDRDSP
jgi:drug/metabolite transporter (DMT)-like permease